MTSILNLLKLKPSTIMFLVMGTLIGTLFFKAVAHDPGYVLLAHGRHTIETSLLVGLLFIILMAFLVFWAWSIMRWLLDPQRGQRQANRRTTRGLIALAHGDWKSAEKLLAKAAGRNEVSLINYLSAAQAAHEQGRKEARDHYLQLANEQTAGVDEAVSLTKARLQYQSSEWEECLATLRKLSQETMSPSYPYVLKMLSQVYQELEDWDSLRVLLSDLKKHRVVNDVELGRLAHLCYQGKIRRAGKGESDEEKLADLQQAWQQIPRKFHTEASLVKDYALALIAVGASGEAERVVTDLLRKNWDDELVQLYGGIQGGDVDKQLLWCENWLKERPNNPHLLLAMGRLCLQNQQWEKAQNYFEASLRSRKSAQAYGEMGRLLSYLGDHQASNEHFQMGLAMIATRLPDLPMPGKPAASSETE